MRRCPPAAGQSPAWDQALPTGIGERHQGGDQPQAVEPILLAAYLAVRTTAATAPTRMVYSPMAVTLSPANTAPVRVDLVPGSTWRYSGGGALVAQLVVIEATGQSYPEFMQEAVFSRIGMVDSTFEQPLPPSRTRQAASGTQWNGAIVPGKWHIYPEMAAAGLWSTPTDLARFAIEIALSRQGLSNRVLSQTMAREMLSPQMDRVTEMCLGDEDHGDRMGLGFFLGDERRPGVFGHIGDDEGFQAMLIMDADTGKGAALMANSPFGIMIGDWLIDAIAKEYAWTSYLPPQRTRVEPHSWWLWKKMALPPRSKNMTS